MVPQFLSFVFESRAEGSLYHALKTELWAEGVDLAQAPAAHFGAHVRVHTAMPTMGVWATGWDDVCVCLSFFESGGRCLPRTSALCGTSH